MPRLTERVRAPRTARPQARGLATRRRVLDAAEQLFAKRGYELASMAEVAARAGVGVGTLYHHFPDKRTLLLELIDDWGDREHARSRVLLAPLRGAGLQKAAIADLIAASSRELARSGGFRLMLLELSERDADVRARLGRIDQAATERLGDCIADRQVQGIVRPGVDPHTAAFLILRAGRAVATEMLVRRVQEPAAEHVMVGFTDMISRYLLEDAGA